DPCGEFILAGVDGTLRSHRGDESRRTFFRARRCCVDPARHHGSGHQRKRSCRGGILMSTTATLQNPGTGRRWLDILGPFIGLFAVIAVFAIISGSPGQFLSAANLRIVFAQTVIVAIGAIGMTVIIISAGIDLSVGATVALTSVITALTLQHGWGPLAAINAGIAVGVIVGLVNALVITKLRV